MASRIVNTQNHYNKSKNKKRVLQLGNKLQNKYCSKQYLSFTVNTLLKNITNFKNVPFPCNDLTHKVLEAKQIIL